MEGIEGGFPVSSLQQYISLVQSCIASYNYLHHKTIYLIDF